MGRAPLQRTRIPTLYEMRFCPHDIMANYITLSRLKYEFNSRWGRMNEFKNKEDEKAYRNDKRWIQFDKLRKAGFAKEADELVFKIREMYGLV